MSRLFGKAVHAGFVVPDLDRELDRLVASGIGPVFVMRRIRVPARHRGVRHDVLISAAFVHSGSMQYEFVQPHDDTPSAYRKHLARMPAGGLHHLAYFADGSFEQAFEHAATQGVRFTTVQEFITPDGTAYELYAEPEDATNPLLVQLMVPGPMEPWFAEMEKAAAHWDGSEPLRDALAMLPPEMRPPVEPAQGAR